MKGSASRTFFEAILVLVALARMAPAFNREAAPDELRFDHAERVSDAAGKLLRGIPVAVRKDREEPLVLARAPIGLETS